MRTPPCRSVPRPPRAGPRRRSRRSCPVLRADPRFTGMAMAQSGCRRLAGRRRGVAPALPPDRPRARSAVMVRPHSGAVAPVTGSAAGTRAAGKERRRRIRGVSLVAGWQGETGLASEPAVLGSSGAGLDALTSWQAAARSGGEQWRRAAGGEERRGRLPWAPGRTSLHPDLLFFCLVSQCTSMFLLQP
ncbi:uncharacterized protein LOC120680134 [Panicum virgatum]|uniref:uncharacterized protein LOC120680134 n=1 Tax=Panicum virgatum TaxID=38727 RepID=UPI0019D51837|nr:uncharacterized protein LOC120680134 [Panicum virgatum]